MTSNNSQLITDSSALIASARNHVIYIESIVNTANIPTDAAKQVESRTLMWATQHAAYAKNDYLKFQAFSSMQGAIQLLQLEIELALSQSWRQSREHVWKGVKEALDKPAPGSVLESWKTVYTATRARAANIVFESEEDDITLEMNDDNLELVLSIEQCTELTYKQAKCWLAHRIMLAMSAEEANEASRVFQAEYSDKVVSKLQIYTPRTLQIAKSEGIDNLYTKINAFLKPETPEKNRSKNKPANMPDELFYTLDSAGAFEARKPPAAEGQSVSPAELMQAVADKNAISIVSMDTWKNKYTDRQQCVIVRNFEFKAIKKPELGRAQYMLMGPSDIQDVRIEMKSQNVSGSACDKLPMSVYRLQKMHKTALYSSTVIGITNTTHFPEDTLELAQAIAKTDSKVVFIENENVSIVLHAKVLSMIQAFQPTVTSALKETLTQQVIIDVLGLNEPHVHKGMTESWSSTMIDEEFGMG